MVGKLVMKKNNIPLFLVIISALVLLGILGLHNSPTAAAKSAASVVQEIALQEDKPVNGWVVCKDLGVGPVPGLSGNRQRIRLCHQAGWEVDTYCLRPDLPVPLVGGSCQRTGPDTYWCGNGLQPLKEYRIRQTPTPTPTETLTPTPSPTPTQTSTQTPTTQATQPTLVPYPTEYPTPRPKPGGLGYRQVLSSAWNLFRLNPARSQALPPTPTPFRPLHPTPSQPVGELALAPTLPTLTILKLPGIDLTAGTEPVVLRIKPDTKKFHAGRPLKISFMIGPDCEFGDGNACLNVYQDLLGAEISLLTVHSGLGGEAQSLRHALEGSGFDQAGLPLNEVEKNLKGLLNSTVRISQGTRGEADLRIIAAIRLPARQVREYIEMPANEILAYAARQNSELLPYLHPNEPLIVLETCGWRMSGEAKPAGLPDTSASIYLLVMGQTQSIGP